MSDVAKFRVLELYSGIGGFHFALRKLLEDSSMVDAENSIEITAVDINTTANNVYRHNFEASETTATKYASRLLERNIQSFSVKELDSMELDLLTMSPPCQPFSRLGLKRDLDDKRCDSFHHLMKTLPLLQHKPRYIMLENVKGFETSSAHRLLLETLHKCRYRFEQFLLTPLQFGIPNARLRYYLVAKLMSNESEKSELSSATVGELRSSEAIHERIPVVHEKNSGKLEQTFNNENCLALFDKESRVDFVESLQNPSSGRTIENYLDTNVDSTSQSLLPMKLLLRYHMLLDIVNPESQTSNCFTKAYTHRIEGTGSVLKTARDVSVDQVYHKLEQLKASLIREENPNGGDDASEESVAASSAELLSSLGMRFFTPREIANLMCFPQEFHFPSDVNRKQQYRVLGNSVNVHVCYYLLKVLLGKNFIPE